MPAAGARLNALCCSAFKYPVSVKALPLYLKRCNYYIFNNKCMKLTLFLSAKNTVSPIIT
jgi:hypothetical protein